MRLRLGAVIPAVLLVFLVVAPVVGDDLPEWMMREGSVYSAIHATPGSHVYIDAVVVDKIKAHSAPPYLTIREEFAASQKLVLLTPPDPRLRLGMLIDCEGDTVQLASGDVGLENVTVRGYTDENGTLLTHGGPLIKGLLSRTVWAYMVDLTSNSSSTSSTTADDSSSEEPNTSSLPEPEFYDSIADLPSGSTQSQQSCDWFQMMTMDNGIGDLDGQEDGSSATLECKRIIALGTETIDGTTYHYIDIAEDSDVNIWVRVYCTADLLTNVTTSDRLQKLVGQVRFREDETPFIDINDGPAYDPTAVASPLLGITAHGKISWARSFPDSALLPQALTGKIVTAGRTDFANNILYVEEPDRSMGIRVHYTGNANVLRSSVVDVTGTITTDTNGERYIDVGTDGSLAITSSDAPLRPYGLGNKDIGGGSLNAFTPGVSTWNGTSYVSASGLHTLGLFARCWGKVTATYSDSFYFDDGSSLNDGTHSGILGIRVGWSMQPEGEHMPSPNVQVGDMVSVNGIASCFSNTSGGSTGTVRELQVRDGADIKLLDDSESADTTAPTVTISTPGSVEVTDSIVPIIVSGTASDGTNGRGVASLKIAIFAGASQSNPQTDGVNDWRDGCWKNVAYADGNWSYQWSGAQPGDYTICVQASDWAGNTSSYSMNVTLVAETATKLSNLQSLPSGTEVNISAKIVTAGSDILDGAFYIEDIPGTTAALDGIKVITTNDDIREADTVNVGGTIQINALTGEREVLASTVTVSSRENRDQLPLETVTYASELCGKARRRVVLRGIVSSESGETTIAGIHMRTGDMITGKVPSLDPPDVDGDGQPDPTEQLTCIGVVVGCGTVTGDLMEPRSSDICSALSGHHGWVLAIGAGDSDPGVVPVTTSPCPPCDSQPSKNIPNYGSHTMAASQILTADFNGGSGTHGVGGYVFIDAHASGDHQDAAAGFGCTVSQPQQSKCIGGMAPSFTVVGTKYSQNLTSWVSASHAALDTTGLRNGSCTVNVTESGKCNEGPDWTLNKCMTLDVDNMVISEPVDNWQTITVVPGQDHVDLPQIKLHDGLENPNTKITVSIYRLPQTYGIGNGCPGSPLPCKVIEMTGKPSNFTFSGLTGFTWKTGSDGGYDPDTQDSRCKKDGHLLPVAPGAYAFSIHAEHSEWDWAANYNTATTELVSAYRDHAGSAVDRDDSVAGEVRNANLRSATIESVQQGEITIKQVHAVLEYVIRGAPENCVASCSLQVLNPDGTPVSPAPTTTPATMPIVASPDNYIVAGSPNVNRVDVRFPLTEGRFGDYFFLLSAKFKDFGSDKLYRIKPTLVDGAVWRYIGTDLDIDSDNDNGFENPARSDAEDNIEDQDGQLGKAVPISSGDTDNDDTVDFADWNIASPGEQFVPLVLQLNPACRLPDNSVTLRFTYPASDPFGVHYDNGQYHLPAGGKFRIWTKKADETRDVRSVRDGGDFVPGDGLTLTLEQLGFASEHTKTFYVESVAPSPSLYDTIHVSMEDISQPTPSICSVAEDTVRVSNIAITGVTVASPVSTTGLECVTGSDVTFSATLSRDLPSGYHYHLLWNFLDAATQTGSANSLTWTHLVPLDATHKLNEVVSCVARIDHDGTDQIAGYSAWYQRNDIRVFFAKDQYTDTNGVTPPTGDPQWPNWMSHWITLPLDVLGQQFPWLSQYSATPRYIPALGNDDVEGYAQAAQYNPTADCIYMSDAAASSVDMFMEDYVHERRHCRNYHICQPRGPEPDYDGDRVPDSEETFGDYDLDGEWDHGGGLRALVLTLSDMTNLVEPHWEPISETEEPCDDQHQVIHEGKDKYLCRTNDPKYNRWVSAKGVWDQELEVRETVDNMWTNNLFDSKDFASPGRQSTITNP